MNGVELKKLLESELEINKWVEKDYPVFCHQCRNSFAKVHMRDRGNHVWSYCYSCTDIREDK